MSDFLGKILQHKREEVDAAVRLIPEATLRLEAERSCKTGRRRLFERLAEPGPDGMNVIAEVKRASPSKGRIRDEVDPAHYARLYERGGAAAISVLTDNAFFGGDPADLRQARAAVELPVLRKDFLISPYQVYESAVMGADAVLLIVRALSPELLKDMLSLCSSLGLDALVEVHNEAEFESAATAGAQLIGVNNRDLGTFKTDIGVSINLAGGIDSGQVIVSESGIHSRSDIERLLDAGIWNFLIGESLMRSEDPVQMLGVLHGESR
ncbi:MAG: indole-3-glycerol phosphate synthase TrpC [Syntrophobacteraceae bacterium]